MSPMKKENTYFELTVSTDSLEIMLECESDDDVSLPHRLGRVRNNHKLACKVWEVQNSN